jgi:hypothetical protein
MMSLSGMLVEPDVTVIEPNRLGLRVRRFVAAAPTVAIRV